MQLDSTHASFSRQEVPQPDSDPGTPMSVLDTSKRRQVAALAKQFEKGVFTSDTSVKRASDVQEQGKRSFEYLKTLLQKLTEVVQGQQHGRQHSGLLDELVLGIDTLEVQWRRKEIYLKEAVLEARKAAEEFRDAADHMEKEVRALKGTPGGGGGEGFRTPSQLVHTASLRESMPSLGHVGELRRRWSLSDVSNDEQSPSSAHKQGVPTIMQGKTRSNPLKESTPYNGDLPEATPPSTHPFSAPHIPSSPSPHKTPPPAHVAAKQRPGVSEAEAAQLRADLTRAMALLALREGELQQLRTAMRTAPPPPPPPPPPALQQPSPSTPEAATMPDGTRPRTLAHLVVPPTRISQSFTAGQHPHLNTNLQITGQAALGETLSVGGVPAGCPAGAVQWCRITEDGQQEPIALATTPQYAPEPQDVGRPVGAIVRRDRLAGLPYNESTPLLTFVPGPGTVEGTPGLDDYVSQMAGSGWGAFNCIIVSCNGREAERRRVFTIVLLPAKVKLQQGGKTRWKQDYHAGMQVAGARGAGGNAAQGAYICFKPTLSFMLAFENAYERNAFLMLTRKMAEKVGVKLGAPSYDLWGPL